MVNAKITQYPTTNNPHRPLYLWQFSTTIDNYTNTVIIKTVGNTKNRVLLSLMGKIPDCDRCLLYTHQIYFVCTVHPEGVETEKCPDFRPDPEAIESDRELWSPVGYSWYGDELIPNRLCRYTREEQEKILDTHPFFTGICPDCKHIFPNSPAPQKTWQCPECGWRESDFSP